MGGFVDTKKRHFGSWDLNLGLRRRDVGKNPDFFQISSSSPTSIMSVLVVLCIFAVSLARAADFRPPATPLIVQDPYISLWSGHDNLYDGDTMHWTGSIIQLFGMVIIDGKCYRWMGADTYKNCPNTVTQESLTVLPLTTAYQFTADNVQLNVNFTTPAGAQQLPHPSPPSPGPFFPFLHPVPFFSFSLFSPHPFLHTQKTSSIYMFSLAHSHRGR